MADVFIPGNHEVEMCYGGEADLHKHVTGCKKNPGHKGFIPLKDFDVNCLPSRYQNDLMSETIKTLAALTVQIKTKYTSKRRPKFYPDTKVPYPCYKARGSHVMRLGTGRVWDADIYKADLVSSFTTCQCAKCQFPATPSKEWGEILLLTSTHVVYNTSEARQTSCVFGFDDNKSPGVSLDGWEEGEESYLTEDLTEIKYVTCDLDELKLVKELKKKCKRFEKLCYEVDDKYERFFDVDRLTVIVSHPHGCPKQVSVGQWTHKKECGHFIIYAKYWYTACTCPGSSGATVYMLEKYKWFHFHPHSGCNSEGNYSGEVELQIKMVNHS